ncbi:MAG TPA: cation:proton antiporter [Candidatus Polarisedimenticolia bacterium]|nr:cation:proton antiporter [Candidatus Polarisedimenticolia bacterium]
MKHSLFLGSLDYYDPMEHQSLLSNIGLAFTIATLCAFIAKLLKQPVILAYLVAGVVIGPEIGFAWVKDKETIDLISEIGLILLLFIIGLEIDLKKASQRGADDPGCRSQPIPLMRRVGDRVGVSDGIRAG